MSKYEFPVGLPNSDDNVGIETAILAVDMGATLHFNGWAWNAIENYKKWGVGCFDRYFNNLEEILEFTDLSLVEYLRGEYIKWRGGNGIILRTDHHIPGLPIRDYGYEHVTPDCPENRSIFKRAIKKAFREDGRRYYRSSDIQSVDGNLFVNTRFARVDRRAYRIIRGVWCEGKLIDCPPPTTPILLYTRGGHGGGTHGWEYTEYAVRYPDGEVAILENRGTFFSSANNGEWISAKHEFNKVHTQCWDTLRC